MSTPPSPGDPGSGRVPEHRGPSFVVPPPARSEGAPPPPPPRRAPRQQNSPQQWVVLGLLVAVFAYFAVMGGSIDRSDLVFFAVLIPSIVLHEVSHGAAALLFGDTTAKDAGRLTLNPLKHVDPFWTILLPAMMVFSTHRAFGMAKPVPVNPGRMRSPRNHGLLTSLAGPATNITLAAVAWVAYRSAYGGLDPSAPFRQAHPPLLAEVLFGLGLANVVLAVFNLIPIPPLDGSAVLERVLPQRVLVPYLRLRRYSFFLFIGLFMLGSDVFGRILNPFIDLWLRLLFT
ncbi:MAG TPA: site-2 protease family protein [Acidimicrobiales bacterium]|nr:site-2 protease family protein [Acidimicrobiales bacterium]